MAKLRVTITMSLDGYVAGPNQSLENPLGEGAIGMHDWAFATRSFREAHGGEGGETGLDDTYVGRSIANVGASIMGRNMFGPIRGPWVDDADGKPWNGWWGDDPPFHTPVFVLTHHPREPLRLGATTFYFVTDGIEAALERALEAAGGKDVAIGGGADTIRQYLRARLVDALEIHVAPLLLGAGERLFEGVDEGLEEFECVGLAASPAAAHFTYVRPDSAREH
jgi:dihydrofolate reductase